ncbi:MAG: hypothetical protein DRJ03_22345 [Chloroflexi bacterium]|nr:MAG: hypothetical protein DRI81_09475 [Chloroflexota bacterium]RLC80102.1 MAG: hypothetical protein DRJ03_22345 [Chloroflexota bacterium]
MSNKRQQGIDPAVAELLVQAENRKALHSGGAIRQKVNLNLPSNLANAIRQTAFALTGHKRRGFSDLAVVLLRYGWEAYQAGELEIELQPVAVEMRIKAVKK